MAAKNAKDAKRGWEMFTTKATKIPARLAPQPKQNKIFHRRDTEFAEFGVYPNQKKIFTPRSLRLRGELPKIGATRAKDSVSDDTRIRKFLPPRRKVAKFKEKR